MSAFCRENLKQSMRRRRKRDLPSDPLNMLEMGAVPDRFRRTLREEPFLIYDSFDHDNDSTESRTVTFATRGNISLLAKSPTWFLDGTFKTAPNIFTQVTFLHFISPLTNRVTVKKIAVILLLVIIIKPNQRSSKYYSRF